MGKNKHSRIRPAGRPPLKRSGSPPGSLIFTGKKHLEQLNVSLTQFTEQDYRCELAHDALPEATATGGIHWYDVRGLHDIELIEQLGMRYQMHPLAIEDVLNIHQRPKFEEYDEALFVVVRALEFNRETMSIDTEQVAIFFTRDSLLSFQEKDGDLFAPIRRRLEMPASRLRSRTTDYLAYALIDAIVDHYFVVLDQLEEELSNLEVEIMTSPSDATKRRIHDLRISIISLRKLAGPMREAINRFAGSEHMLIAPTTPVFLRDLFDHAIRVVELTDTTRDLLNGLQDLYLSEISFRTNNVIQLLTIISTIFIPLTFLAGVYGMNFKHMPELEWPYAYYGLWGVMIGIVLFQLYYFRRRKWL